MRTRAYGGRGEQGVAQGSGRDGRRLRVGERRHEPGFHLFWQGFLGDDDDACRSRGKHRADVADGHDGAAPGAGHLRATDPGPVGDVGLRRCASPRRRRAAPSRPDSRCADRQSAGRAEAARRATRSGPMSCSRDAGRAGSPAGQARGWPAGRATARRATRPGAVARSPGRHRRRRRPGARQSAGSIDASQSQNATNSAPAARSPAWQAAPYPRVAHGTTSAPSERAIAADPSDEPLSTTIARACRRHSRQDPGQRAGLVQARQHDVDERLHASPR